MILKVEWVNAMRTGHEKLDIENQVRDSLLNHYGTPEDVFCELQSYHRSFESPRHPWVVAFEKARYIATRGLLPSERNICHFVVKVS